MARTKQTARLPTPAGGKTPRQVMAQKSARPTIGVKSLPVKRVHVYPQTNKKRFRNGMRALREIVKYQKSTDLLIPRIPFQRVIRDIIADPKVVCPATMSNVRLAKTAVEALQEAAEAFLVRMFEDANLATAHAKRLTLMDSDIKLVMRLREK